jgi:uncharacterized membrane protein YhaH (DUF805 family)
MILVEAWKLVVLKRYAKFDGRADRAEFWWFMLANVIAYVGLTVLFVIGLIISDVLGVLLLLVMIGYWLGMIVPTLAVATRRLHDTNKSGLLLLLYLVSWVPLVGLGIGIMFIVFYATAGTPGPNDHGALPDTGPQAAPRALAPPSLG